VDKTNSAAISSNPRAVSSLEGKKFLEEKIM